MRVGLIGTGWVSGQHLDAIAAAGHQAVAVAGRQLAKAEALAKPRGAAAYDDWQRMVANERLDALWICVIPSAAAALARACAGQVRGVLVEKPVGIDPEEAAATARAFAEAGTVAGAAYHNRSRAVVARVRELCAGTAPAVANAWWHAPMPGPAWWRSRAGSGGQMSEQATHLVDLLRVWLGEAIEVSAAAAHGFVTGVEGYDVDDAICATIRFASGAVANVQTSCHELPGHTLDPIGIHMHARGWSARLSGWSLDAELQAAGGEVQRIPGESDGFKRQAAAFLAAVAAGDPRAVPCSYADGVATLRLTRAIDVAAASGKPVRLG